VEGSETRGADEFNIYKIEFESGYEVGPHIQGVNTEAEQETKTSPDITYPVYM
jgi:hypothetical protein